MPSETKSTNWGICSLASLNEGLGVNVKATLYAFKNFDTFELFLFVLGDIGLGYSAGFKFGKIYTLLLKSTQKLKDIMEGGGITHLSHINYPFSADDLAFASGAEMFINISAGIGDVGAALGITNISAWPSSHPIEPNGSIVNFDYFSGESIYSTKDFGLSAGCGYQFKGIWLKVPFF